MKIITKKILLIIFTITVLVSVAALCSCNNDEQDKEQALVPTEGLEYTLNSDGEAEGYTVSGIGSATDREIVIASTYNGKPVTAVGKAAFHGCSNLTSITIPDCVTTIGVGAFFNCSGLTSITIPAGVTAIGETAFENCGRLATVYWNAIESANMGSIDYAIFNGCVSLTTAVIGENVKSISKYIFNNCNSLETVYWNAKECISVGADNYVYSFLGSCSNLVSVVIGDNVTSIPSRAFDGCKKLTSITIPKSVISIGASAFVYCSSLTSVYYTGDMAGWCSIRFDGSYANPWYYAHNLYINNELVTETEIVIPNTINSIGDCVFYGCTSIKSVTIPDSITSIGADAFRGCDSLTSVYYTGDITGWCNIDFSNSSANPVSIAHNLYIRNELVTDIVIPDTVKEIKPYVFSGCRSIVSVNIENGVTTIDDGAFRNCPNLISIIIPKSVTIIGSNAFYNDQRTMAYYRGTRSDWIKIVFKYPYGNPSWYYYSETQPTEYDNYWHYVDGIVTIWDN